jgi:hypothetical protein
MHHVPWILLLVTLSAAALGVLVQLASRQRWDRHL